jgi:hypothetical protein
MRVSELSPARPARQSWPGVATGGQQSGHDPMDRPGMRHRGLSVLALIGLLGVARDLWPDTVPEHPGYGIGVITAFGAILVLGVLALTVPNRAAIRLVDAATLVVGIVLFIAYVRTTFVIDSVQYPSDVGLVMQSGAEALIRGEHLYGVPRPDAMRALADGGRFFPTLTMTGHLVSDYGYPPLGAIITATLIPITHGLPTASIVSALAMIATAILLFKLLPAVLRPAAVLVCFVLGPAVDYAASGYPAIMALPFLVFAVANWPVTGADGRLGQRGVAQAISFGLALATHQLVWYVAPFIVVGLWLIRRGHLPGRTATRVVASYVGIMMASWTATNLPFVLQDAGAWWRGMLEPLTQHAVPFGQGVVGLASYYTDGSGGLDWLGMAPKLLAVGLLVAYALLFRHLGPAATVLPWLIFYVSTRSQNGYYGLLVPIWLLGAVTLIHRFWFQQAYRLPMPRNRFRWVRIALAACLPVAALGSVAVGLATPPPLQLQVIDWMETGGHVLWKVQVDVTNKTDRPVTPRFSVTEDHAHIGSLWSVIAGPTVLGPHEHAYYALVAPDTSVTIGAPTRAVTLRAITAEPMTITNVAIPGGHRPRSTVLLATGQPGLLAPGQSFTFTAQLRDYQQRDRQLAGVAITLQARWITGESTVDDVVTVNGQRFVDGRFSAITDANGQVRFTVVASRSLDRPLVFGTADPDSDSPITLHWFAP